MPAALKGRLAIAAAAACCSTGLANAQSLRLDTSLSPRAAPADLPEARAPRALELRLAVMLGAPSRVPDPAPAPAPLPPRIPLIATVKVNEQDKGDHALVLEGEDDFLAPRELVSEWIEVPAGMREVTVEGAPHVRLRDIPGTRLRFDEATLVLRVDFPSSAFRPQVLRYQASDRPLPTPVERTSAIVNYQLGASGDPHAGSPAWNAALSASIRRGAWLLRTSANESLANGVSTTARGLTALTREDPIALTRFTLGDFVTGIGELGGGLTLGGIAFARALDLDPYTVRQPGAGYRTVIDLPSQVEVYVGDTRILRQAVAPGPLQLDNLTYLTGRRDVRVVIKDVFGRERDVAFPFYFADRGLAAGVQDYSYGVGPIRRNLGNAAGDYGDLAVSAFHRIGLDDTFTVGFQAEGTRDVVNGGPAATARTGLGIFSLSALASHDRRSGRSGAAGGLGYTFQAGDFSTGLTLLKADRAYAVVRSDPSAAGPPLTEALASISWSRPGRGSLTGSVRYSEPREQASTRGYAVAYSYPLTRDWQLQASWRRDTGFLQGREFLLSLQYVAPRNVTGQVTFRDAGASRGAAFSVATLQPDGEGVAYGISGDVNSSDRGQRGTVAPEFLWNSRYATLQVGATHAGGGGSPDADRYRVSVSGSIAAVGGVVGLSRPIEDSFAVARIEPAIADVRVYLNQQYMGRTDRHGEIFLPRLVSYVQNAVTIDDRDVPIERALDRKGATVVPWSRSGTLVGFEAPLARSITGRLTYRDGVARKPLEYALVILTAGSGRIEVPTARGGDFYLENIPPGDYPARVDIGGRACRFTFTIPPSDEAFLELHDVPTCEFP